MACYSLLARHVIRRNLVTTFETDASSYIPLRRLERPRVVYPGDDVNFGSEEICCEVDSYGLSLRYTKKVKRYEIACYDPACFCKGRVIFSCTLERKELYTDQIPYTF